MLYLIGVVHLGKIKSSDFLSKNPKENDLFLKILKEEILHFTTWHIFPLLKKKQNKHKLSGKILHIQNLQCILV